MIWYALTFDSVKWKFLERKVVVLSLNYFLYIILMFVESPTRLLILLFVLTLLNCLYWKKIQKCHHYLFWNYFHQIIIINRHLQLHVTYPTSAIRFAIILPCLWTSYTTIVSTQERKPRYQNIFRQYYFNVFEARSLDQKPWFYKEFQKVIRG